MAIIFRTPGHRYFIRCPQTKKLVFAIRAMSREELKETTKGGEQLCSECGQMHKWESSDLVEEGEKT
jgi:hypothetical protein